MIFNKIKILKLSIIFLIISSFFAGYFLRENSVGGGGEFYLLSWPIIQSFKQDFLFTLKNYGQFGDFTIPFLHIINAYLNPFSNNIPQFQLTNTLVSLTIPLIFFLALKKIFKDLNYIDGLLVSSTFLLLPFFRTSAFWGKNENYGWLFLLVALYFFYKIKNEISEKNLKINYYNIFFFCFSSSCALYSRQALAFLPISYFLYLFFNNANKKIIITSIFTFLAFSIPAICLIFFWGNVFELNSTNHPFFKWWIHPRNILRNIPIVLSFFAFYLMPILFIEFLNSDYKKFTKKYLKAFLYSLIFFIILMQFGVLDYLGQYTRAGGAVLKVNYLIMKHNFLLLLIFSSIGFSILFNFFKEDKKNNITFLAPMLIIYCFPSLLYQEYVEPLILIVFFLALKTKLHKIYFKNILISNLIFTVYFSIYLIGSIYFKHFAFDTWEKWKIFLNL